MSQKKELEVSKYPATLDQNLTRLLESDRSTLNKYLGRFFGLLKQQGVDLKQPIASQNTQALIDSIEQSLQNLFDKRSQGQIKFNTFRYYRASLICGITLIRMGQGGVSRVRQLERPLPVQLEQYEYQVQLLSQNETTTLARLPKPVGMKEQYAKFAIGAGVHHDIRADRLEEWYERLTNYQEDKHQTKLWDKTAAKAWNTSSRKEKGFKTEILVALYNRLQRRTDKKATFLEKLLFEFIHHNLMFGLRPMEWQQARLLSYEELQQRLFALRTQQAAFANCVKPKDQFFVQFEQVVYQLRENTKAGERLQQPSPDPQACYYLEVKNAKASGQRACGPYRYLELSKGFEEGSKALQRLKIFMKHMQPENMTQEAYAEKITGPLQATLRQFLKSDKKMITFLNRLESQRQLAYERAKLKAMEEGKGFVTIQPCRKLPTLYSTRHQAIANAKQQGYNKADIAAMFGHSSTATADNHYADKRKGRGGRVKLTPHAYNVAMVVADMSPHAAHVVGASPELWQVLAQSTGKVEAVQVEQTPRSPSRDFGV